jgi:hypothetical protein
MIVYEITATVRPDLRDKYEEYMRETHIADLLATGDFVSASVGRSDNGTFQIRYVAKTRKNLDRYLETHAEGVRKDAAEHFPEGVEITRKEWEILTTFGPNV